MTVTPKPPAPKRPPANKQIIIDQKIIPLVKRIEQLCRVHGISYLSVLQPKSDEVIPSWHIADESEHEYLLSIVTRVNNELDDVYGGDDDAS